jgi:GxxExxY protein
MDKEDITHQIIGCAYTVFNTLGFGFLESVYQNALRIELNKAELIVEAEKGLEVHYEGQVVGSFSVDLMVNKEIVVELKSVQNLAKAHEVQLVNYLNGLQKEIGLLINFGPSGVKVKRKYRSVEESS